MEIVYSIITGVLYSVVGFLILMIGASFLYTAFTILALVVGVGIVIIKEVLKWLFGKERY